MPDETKSSDKQFVCEESRELLAERGGFEPPIQLLTV